MHMQSLNSKTITAVDDPAKINEMPLVVLAATQAQGDTVISGASELHVKESDRIATVTTQLNKLGADIEPREDGFYIHGGTPLQFKIPTIIDYCGEHHLWMIFTLTV